MGRPKRSKIFKRDKCGIYHCTQKINRGRRLMGKDKLSKKSFHHRRRWVQDQLREMARGYAFDVLAFAIMENHLHVVLRNRPDIAIDWTDEQVARRWWQVHPQRKNENGRAAVPNPEDLAPSLVVQRNQELRERLGDLSWYMRDLALPIARRANAEDEVKGHFFQDRYKATALADEMAVLACCVYVDLNPIRAHAAETPETSLYTSLRARLLTKLRDKGYEIVENEANTFDEWLAPIELDERASAYQGAMPSATGDRLSDKGFLAMSAEAYFELVDWTGRQQRTDGKTGVIPASLEPILARIGLEPSIWCVMAQRFGKIFKHVAGSPETLSREAAKAGNRWFQTSGSPLKTAKAKTKPN